MKKVVGYIRVSTPKQGEEGISLDEQAHMLRGYCDSKKLNLLSIEEDDRSAAGAQDHKVRPGLRKAISIAKNENANILVPSVDRLARNPAILHEILQNNLQIISIAEGRRLGRKALERLLDRAKRERDQISKRAREGAFRAKKRGIKLGNPTNLDVAQRNGAVANAVRADRKVQELADAIQRTPGWNTMTLREKVETLNRSGLHNLISEKRNERHSWTMSSIRKPLKRAEEELALRKAIEDDPIVIAPNCASGFSQGGLVNDQSVDVAQDTALDNGTPIADAYKDHPDFGKF